MALRISSLQKLAAIGVVLFVYLIESPTSAFPILPGIAKETAPNVLTKTVDLAVAQVLEAPFPFEFPKEQNGLDLFPMPKCNGVTLEEATIDQLQDTMNTGLLTTSQIVVCYMQRISQTDMYLEYDFVFCTVYYL